MYFGLRLQIGRDRARVQDRWQAHPSETLIVPRVWPQVVPLRRNGEMNQRRVPCVDCAIEMLERRVEIAGFRVQEA